MNVIDFCQNYFSGFAESLNFKNKSALTNMVSVLKCMCSAILFPLFFVAACGSAALEGRVKKDPSLSKTDRKVSEIVGTFPTSTPKILGVSKNAYSYKEFTEQQKNTLKRELSEDEKSLKIHFSDAPAFDVTIRKQDLFKSNAKAIVNAANTHLGGGGGIDGAIHKIGGDSYRLAHGELRKAYEGKYVSGHAAMIESGSLKEAFNIDNVIVVAGPSGKPSASNNDALYSCYYNSLKIADEMLKPSIAFPAISTGIYGYDSHTAASISLKAIHDFIKENPGTTLKTISIHFYEVNPNGIDDFKPYQALFITT